MLNHLFALAINSLVFAAAIHAGSYFYKSYLQQKQRLQLKQEVLWLQQMLQRQINSIELDLPWRQIFKAKNKAIISSSKYNLKQIKLKPCSLILYLPEVATSQLELKQPYIADSKQITLKNDKGIIANDRLLLWDHNFSQSLLVQEKRDDVFVVKIVDKTQVPKGYSFEPSCVRVFKVDSIGYYLVADRQDKASLIRDSQQHRAEAILSEIKTMSFSYQQQSCRLTIELKFVSNFKASFSLLLCDLEHNMAAKLPGS